MTICGTMDEVRLNDYVDETLDAGTRRSIEGHLGECAACRALVDDLRSLRSAAARLPRSIDPSRDLWPELERRIGHASAAGEKGRPWRGILAAAAAVVVLAAGAALLLDRASGPPHGALRPEAGTRGDAMRASLREAEADYERVSADLETLLRQRRSRMSPATVDVIERNLAIIDEAFWEIRTALENDPRSAAHRALLTSLCRQKMMLLEQATSLPPRS